MSKWLKDLKTPCYVIDEAMLMPQSDIGGVNATVDCACSRLSWWIATALWLIINI